MTKYNQKDFKYIKINEYQGNSNIDIIDDEIVGFFEKYRPKYLDKKFDFYGEYIDDETKFVKCDFYFEYKDRIILIESERSDRPVESITKYWRLFKKTNWFYRKRKINSGERPIKYLIIYRPKERKLPTKSRREQVRIVGEHLMKKYVGFEFNELDLLDDNIQKVKDKLSYLMK